MSADHFAVRRENGIHVVYIRLANGQPVVVGELTECLSELLAHAHKAAEERAKERAGLVPPGKVT